MRGRIRTDRRLAYDDLLIELDDALAGAGGKRLAAQIRREFPCALIDEYQDTDPVQARIFGRNLRRGPGGLGRARGARWDAPAGVVGPDLGGFEDSAGTRGRGATWNGRIGPRR